MITTYERGKTEGRLEGVIQTLRETALIQLDTKFGPLKPEVRRHVAELNAEQLRQLLADFAKASSLQELHLGE
jgi:hypothetical protein